MLDVLPGFLRPGSKFGSGAIEWTEIRSSIGPHKFHLLLQEDFEELFGIGGQFFNLPILIPHLFCCGEVILPGCFKQNLHSCCSDIVGGLERFPPLPRELAVLFEEFEVGFEILQLPPH